MGLKLFFIYRLMDLRATSVATVYPALGGTPFIVPNPGKAFRIHSINSLSMIPVLPGLLDLLFNKFTGDWPAGMRSGKGVDFPIRPYGAGRATQF